MDQLRMYACRDLTSPGLLVIAHMYMVVLSAPGPRSDPDTHTNKKASMLEW
jgi:hypothetical protein